MHIKSDNKSGHTKGEGGKFASLVQTAGNPCRLPSCPTAEEIFLLHTLNTHWHMADIDKSLDLEKFSKRNYSWFSLSSWRSEFSCLVLLSIFKILRKHFSFSSRFLRFSFWNYISPLNFQDFVEQFPKPKVPMDIGMKHSIWVLKMGLIWV